jgi:hypothetical protein
MLTASDFTETDDDYEGYGYAIASAQIKTAPFLPIGKADKSRYKKVDVQWLRTKRFDLPDDKWLSMHFPVPDDCVSGFTAAFTEYHDRWCGKQMREEILRTAEGERRRIFEAQGWIPFVSISTIKINADANLISYDCNIVSDLDYNLDEHGICIIKKDAAWKFGYGCEDMGYFSYWEDRRIMG